MIFLTISFIDPAFVKADDNLPFLIRVLLKEGLSEVNLTHKNEGVGVLIDNNDELILPLRAETIKIIKGNSGVYLLKVQDDVSFSRALKFSNESVIPMVAESDLNVFLYTIDNILFDVEIGPFEAMKDAVTVKELIKKSISFIEVESFPSKSDALSLKVAEKIFLRSSFSSQESPISCLKLRLRNDQFSLTDKQYNGTIEFCKANSKISVINVLDIEEYLRGVVPSEMPSSWHYEALCAQAVAARTFAFSRLLSSRNAGSYYDVCDTTHCQVYLGTRTTPATDKAIKDTAGLMLTYNKYPIEAVFHSSSGGQTENNENIWQGSPRPYLRSVASPGEEISPHFTWYKAFEMSEFLKTVNSYLKNNNQKELDTINSIEIIERGSSPRVKKVSIKGDKNEIILSGSEIQSIFSLKSTWFDFLVFKFKNETPAPPAIIYFRELLNNKDKSQSLTYVYIYGRGWGHGIGMPQYGAYAMANRGASYEEILSHYYKGTKLEKITEFNKNLSLDKLNLLQSGFCRLYFDPSNAKIYKEEAPTNIEIKINSGASIYGISFTLSFDENLIDIDEGSIKEGNFLKADGSETIFLKSKVKNGIYIGIVRKGRVGGVSGEGALLSFSIKGFNKGSTEVYLSDMQISDPKLDPVGFDYEPLKVQVTERDKAPPKTYIVSYPDKFTNQKNVYFEWSGSDDTTETKNLFYSYRLNDEPWSQFSQETSRYFNLIYDGKYKFEVKARDEAGNIDSNPPVYEFSLDSTPPFIELGDYPKKTFQKSVILNGIVEVDSNLLINGENITLDENGRFSFIAELKIGDNFFRFIVIDNASNSKTLDITIIREQATQTVIILTVGSTKALIDGVVINLDVAPLIKNDRTFVPLRFIAESFKAEVGWEANEKRIDINLKHPLINKKITLWINKNIALVDNKEVVIDALPFILPPGRTLVPIRFISECFDAKVEWEPLVKNIIITFPKDEVLMNEWEERNKDG